MVLSRSGLLAATLLVAGAVPTAAQAVNVFTYGGGYTALKEVNAIGTVQFKTGFTIGGGIGYEVDKNVELRFTLTGAQSQLVEDGSPTGVYLNRYYIAADVKGGYPLANGLKPYAFLGAGAVLLHEKGSSGADKTQGFVHLGLGIAYSVGKSGLSVFAQGDGLAYSLTGMSSPTLARFSATQIDLAWSLGASYRLPL